MDTPAGLTSNPLICAAALTSCTSRSACLKAQAVKGSRGYVSTTRPGDQAEQAVFPDVALGAETVAWSRLDLTRRETSRPSVAAISIYSPRQTWGVGSLAIDVQPMTSASTPHGHRARWSLIEGDQRQAEVSADRSCSDR